MYYFYANLSYYVSQLFVKCLGLDEYESLLYGNGETINNCSKVVNPLEEIFIIVRVSKYISQKFMFNLFQILRADFALESQQ
mgnify:CR=1 FL=1